MKESCDILNDANLSKVLQLSVHGMDRRVCHGEYREHASNHDHNARDKHR